MLPALLIALAASFVAFGSARAHPVGQVTVHVAECPTGVGGGIFDECHGNSVAGVAFTVSSDFGTADLVTDGNGLAETFFQVDFVALAVDPAVAASYLGSYVFCSNPSTGEVLFDGDRQAGEAVEFNLPRHEDGSALCDWYLITPAADGGVDDSGGTVTTSLPGTGIGLLGGASSPLAALAVVAGLAVCAAVALRPRMT
jgi:hypothetical protein